MRDFTKILIWENNRRLEKLSEFRELLFEYFNNSEAGRLGSDRIEQDAAGTARVKLNRILDDTYAIVRSTGINSALTWAPPRMVGGPDRQLDLIHNVFNIGYFNVGPELIFDTIDRAIGMYQTNHRSALFRTFNPFFYVAMIFETISELPFIAIGKLGFSRQKAESSLLGRLAKGITWIGAVLVALLTILQLLDFLEPVKEFVHELLDSNRAK